MQPRTVHQLPEGYQEALYFRVTERGKIIWLNLIAIGLLFVYGVLFIGGLLLYHWAGAPFVIEALPTEFSTTLGLVIVIAVLPLHEWIHGLAIAYCGHQPRYGIKPLKGVLYATADGALFWRNQYILVALAPLVVISGIVIALSLVVPAGTALWFCLAGVMNATGAVGDIWMTAKALAYPPTALIRDEEDGMRVFA